MTKNKSYLFIVFPILLLVFFLASLLIGEYPLSAGDIKAVLFGGNISELKRNVFWNLRLPRSIMAVLAGAGLSFTGNVFQTIFKNPLASPDIIGVTSGATLGAAVAIVLFGGTTISLVPFAFWAEWSLLVL